MPPTPKEEEKKKKSGTKKESTMTNDREREKDDEKALANAFAAASLEPSTGATDEVLAATGSGEDASNPEGPPCDGCKQPFAGIMRCSKCDSAFYCGRDCQLSHWTAGGHKKECKQLQKLKKKNEETARHVLENFENVLGCWMALDAAGAYKAAVRQGLHNKIREMMEMEKTKIADRFRNCRGVFCCYTPWIMSMLFRGAGTSPFEFTHVDALKIEGYVWSHCDALDTWLQACVQLLRDVTDRDIQRDPVLSLTASNAARDAWLGWALAFTNAIAARAILTPFPSATTKGATDNGGENTEQRRTQAKVHVRGIVKTLGEALRLVCGDADPLNLSAYVRLVCALVLVRTREYGIGIDVERFLKMDEAQKATFLLLYIPAAKRMIEKGAILNEEELSAMTPPWLRR